VQSNLISLFRFLFLTGVLFHLFLAPCQAFQAGDFIRVAPDNFSFVTSASSEKFLPMGAFYFDDCHPGIDPMRWWETFDEERVKRDFAMARELGCNTLRITFFMTVETEGLATSVVGTASDFVKCDRIIQIAEENNLRLYVAPRILGEFIQEPVALGYFQSIFAQLADRYRDEPTIFCWELDAEATVLVGYAGDRDFWNAWLLKRYGEEATIASAWGLDSTVAGWKDQVWQKGCGALHHHSGYDTVREATPQLWYLDSLNKPNDACLYDWQLFREALYVSKMEPLAEIIRAHDPNHLVTVDLILWAFPLYRNQAAPGWGGPYGYSAIDLEQIGMFVDFLGFHSYPFYIPVFTSEWYENLSQDPKIFNRELRYLETAIRYVRARSGRPVVLSETGWHGGEGDYAGNSEANHRDWNLALIRATKDCAVGWINWILYDVPVHEGITAWGGLVTKRVRLRPDSDNINPLSAWLYDGMLFYRLMQQAVATASVPYRQLVNGNHNM
jgi:hypothetical protein